MCIQGLTNKTIECPEAVWSQQKLEIIRINLLLQFIYTPKIVENAKKVVLMNIFSSPNSYIFFEKGVDNYNTILFVFVLFASAI